MVEAKKDSSKPFTSLLTVDHFKEIERFERWLAKLEYSGDIPGIPINSKYKETPSVVTFYDMA